MSIISKNFKIMKRILITFLVLLLLFPLITCTRENERHNIILNATHDVDGNNYNAVRLGKQVWMMTNLRTRHFQDGSEIPLGTQGDYSEVNPYAFVPTMSGYDSNMHGLYYNAPAVYDDRGLCPKGWHVPTHEEWTELADYVGSCSEYVYNHNPKCIAKALASKTGWDESYDSIYAGSPNYQPELNNATGFTAIPTFNGNEARFWAIHSTYDDVYWGLESYSSVLFWDGRYGLRASVRCIRDEQ